MVTKYKVYLRVYDLSNGAMKKFSPLVLNCSVAGVWHSSVVVYGTECYFGQKRGISGCKPGCYNHNAVPVRIIYMGLTEIKPEVFVEYLKGIESRYRSIDYSLTRHNCNTFTNELCQFLLGKEIPDYIKNICTEIMQTPTGQEIRPIVEGLEDLVGGFKGIIEMFNGN